MVFETGFSAPKTCLGMLFRIKNVSRININYLVSFLRAVFLIIYTSAYKKKKKRRKGKGKKKQKGKKEGKEMKGKKKEKGRKKKRKEEK
jgi:mannitol-specific phosphotransferase system IIBC component